MLLHRQDDVQLPQNIGGQRRGWVAPGRRHVRLGGEMEDPVRLDSSKRGLHAVFVRDVRAVELNAIAKMREMRMRPRRVRQAPYVGSLRHAHIGKVAARKAGDAGNEYAHGERLLELCEAEGSCGDYTRL